MLIGIATLVAAGSLFAATVPASADADHRKSGDFAFGIVRMDGRQEIGPDGQPGAGDLDGKGRFAFIAFDSQLCYLLTARKIEPAVVAHIHAAPRGVNGAIMVHLVAPTEGFSADCIRAVPDSENTPELLSESELAAIIADPAGYYANVHNADFPAGAIRGQLR